MIQTPLLLPVFIISLVKSVSSNLQTNLRGSSIWLLVLGILAIALNVFHFVPGTLIIIAGSIGLSRTNGIKKSVENDGLATETFN